MEELNKNIHIVEKERKKHSKASEEYIHVQFDYAVDTWDGWVPVEYRRSSSLSAGAGCQAVCSSLELV